MKKKKTTKDSLKQLFSSCKGWKIDPQRFKDEIRREEAEKEARLEAQRNKNKRKIK